MADANWSNVVLLLAFDEIAGTTIPTDSSNSAHTITTSGSPVGVSQTVSKFGPGSYQIATAVSQSAGLRAATGLTDFNFGSGQFTVEAWVYLTVSSNTTQQVVASQWINAITSNLGWALQRDGSGNIQFLYSLNGTTTQTISAAWAPSTATWYHVAVDRDASGVIRLYVDGVVKASATDTSSFYASTRNLAIGNSESNNVGWPGYIDEVRITKGVARYGGAFTPSSTAFETGTTTAIRVSQVPVEALTVAADPELRVTQVPVEVLAVEAGTLRVSQVGLETLYNQSTATPLRVSQVGLEVLRSTAAIVAYLSVSNLSAYAVTGSATATAVSNLAAYAVTGAGNGIGVSNLTAYAVYDPDYVAVSGRRRVFVGIMG